MKQIQTIKMLVAAGLFGTLLAAIPVGVTSDFGALGSKNAQAQAKGGGSGGSTYRGGGGGGGTYGSGGGGGGSGSYDTRGNNGANGSGGRH